MTMPSGGTYEAPAMSEEFLKLAGVATGKGRRITDEQAELALSLIRYDVHPSSPRPCGTCRKITAILGEPFWCLRHALQEASPR